jgi:hypothetical protein
MLLTDLCSLLLTPFGDILSLVVIVSDGLEFEVLSATGSFDWWKDVAVMLVSRLILTGAGYS